MMKAKTAPALLLAAMILAAAGLTACGEAQINEAEPVSSAEEEPGTTQAMFSRKVDGDTAWFVTEEFGEIKVRFLGIDTPETVKEGTEVQEWGPEASAYTAGRLSEASEIVLEWDGNSDLTDKYGRYLAWVWCDGSLLNEELVRHGYAEVAYLYGNYKYTARLYAAQEAAQEEKAGIWSE